jgi:hypothetical protein
VRSHDLAGQRLRAHRSLAEHLDLLALLVQLLNHVALVRRRLCQQLLEGESLVGPLVGELLVRCFALVKASGETILCGFRLLKLLPQAIHVPLLFLLFRQRFPLALFRQRSLKESFFRCLLDFGLESISLGCYLLQPASQVLKVRSSVP